MVRDDKGGALRDGERVEGGGKSEAGVGFALIVTIAAKHR